MAMDINRENYELGLPVIEKAGVAHKIDIREGPALSVLGLPMEDFKTRFRVLDMVLISGEDLKQVKHFFKMDVFALASVQGYNNNLYNVLQKTPTGKDGGPNPYWNYPMKFLIDVVAAENSCLTLVINLKANGSFGHKDVGEVHVPVKELLDKYGASNDEMLHASYKVWTTRSGKFKGVLHFSFKFENTVVPAPAAPGSSVAAPPTAGGYPYPLALGYGGYQLPQMQLGNTVVPAPGSSVAAPPTAGGYQLPQMQLENTVVPAPGSSVAAPPTAGGYPYPLALGYGGYQLPQMQLGNTVVPAPGSNVAAPPTAGGYQLPQMQLGNTVVPAPGSSVAAPPTAGGYPYPLVLGYGGYQLPQMQLGNTVVPAPGSSVAAPPTAGGYLYPLALGYGGYQLPQMQPPEETSMGKKIAKNLGALFFSFGKIAVTDAIFDHVEG